MENSNYKDSKVKLGNDEWTVKYFPQVRHPKTLMYCKAARLPYKKEIWLSLNDENGNKFSVEDITMNFKKAILPIVIEDTKGKYGEEKTNEALRELGMSV